jgi:hypothetical protein
LPPIGRAMRSSGVSNAGRKMEGVARRRQPTQVARREIVYIIIEHSS